MFYLHCLETTGLIHYPKNRKMPRGTITFQLFPFVEPFPSLHEPRAKTIFFSFIYNSDYKGKRVVGISVHKNTRQTLKHNPQIFTFL